MLDLLHKKIHRVIFLCKRSKAYHAAAGEAGFRVWHEAETSATA